MTVTENRHVPPSSDHSLISHSIPAIISSESSGYKAVKHGNTGLEQIGCSDYCTLIYVVDENLHRKNIG